MRHTQQILGPLVSAISLLASATGARAEGSLLVHSNGDCPSGQAVSDALAAVRPAGEWPALTATVDVAANGVELILGDDPRYRRAIPLPDDCAERANRIALVIAVWSGEMASEVAAAPVSSPPEPTLTLSSASPAPTPLRSSALVTEVGISGFYAGVGGWVPGGRIELGRLQRTGPWGLRASVAHQTARSLRVDIGDSQYDRTSVAAALVLKWSRPRLFLSSDWGIVGAWTRAHGDGYSENQSTSGQNLGLAIDARAGLRLGKLSIWTALGVCRWALSESIRVDRLSTGPSTTHALPAWDAQLGLGTSLLFD